MKKLFCKHKNNNELVYWRWVYCPHDSCARSIEAQLKCKDCGRYHHLYIYDWNECNDFVAEYKYKEWSNTL